MNEVSFVAGEADPGLRDRLDEELDAFNAAVSGHHDGRLLSIEGEGHHDFPALAGEAPGTARADRASHRPAR